MKAQNIINPKQHSQKKSVIAVPMNTDTTRYIFTQGKMAGKSVEIKTLNISS